MDTFHNDIMLQKSFLEKAVSGYLGPETVLSIQKIKERRFSKIIFTGMGSSHFCALSAFKSGSAMSVISRSLKFSGYSPRFSPPSMTERL